ncbi:glycosyltransferase family 1 protein [Nocardioides euryhalodurans]|uniref:Glycosyltransferase family 1 protein n=2 Tax=Nocardioides euryhalodurans TaxID=2518370 RepID=A0A4P7GQG8_9ACTN|nr:glycosyltransferase family 1 protein [Nocardioides euryhalodurans]
MSLALLLATELAVDVEAGHETYGLSAPGRFVPTVTALGVEHVPLPSLTRSWDPRRDLRGVRELVQALRRLRPDVLHTHNPKTGVIGRVAGRLLGVPVVVNTCHGLWASPSDRLRRRLPVYTAEVVASWFSHAELFQNATDRQTLTPWLRAGRSEVVGNGTDLVRFRHSPDERRRLRAELGVADDTVVVGGVGRMVAEKGIREFLATADRLTAAHGDDVAFVWVGPDDPDKPDAWAVAGTGVRFLGERSDMPAVYSALDVFVLPSYREGFSRSAMEAAACRTAMVLSDIRGCREVGVDGTHLLLSPPGDADALTDRVGRLVADADLRTRLARAAEQRAHAEFDQRRIAARSLTTYADVARRRGLGWTEVRP